MMRFDYVLKMVIITCLFGDDVCSATYVIK